jgi:tripartite ATP-independent transporter DctM subunit
MSWPLLLLVIVGSFLVLMFFGMTVGMAFVAINVIGVWILWGGETGLQQYVLSIYNSLAAFQYLPILMFTFMGEVMFLSGVGPRMFDAVDKWLGKIPGRLNILSIICATIFATLTGSTIGATATFGTVMAPQMIKRGYDKSLVLGCIMGCGGLAMLIPPTGLGIVLAALAEISIGTFLIAIVIPGVITAILYMTYVIGRCWLNPELAPAYDIEPVSLSQKIILALKYIVPMGLIVFLVLGLIFLGVATPSESAALGTVGCIFLAACYGGLSWNVMKKSIQATVVVGGMIFFIIAGATIFSQILAFSGATRGLVKAVMALGLPPMLVIIAMQFIVIIMGCFMEPTAIMMITLPMYMPIVKALAFDPIWFCVVMLVNIELAQLSPPFGIILFTMKSVAPPDTTMGEIYRAAIPFCILDLIVMILLMLFPSISLLGPLLMKG